MKLLFVIGQMSGGGAERVMALLVNKLADRGYEVDLLVVSGDSAYAINEKINYHRIFTEEERKAGKLIKLCRAIWAIKKFLAQWRGEVVISFIPQTTLLVLAWAKLYKKRLIASEHSSFNGRGFLMSLSRRVAYPYVDCLLSLTEHDAKIYRKWVKEVVVLPNPLAWTPIKSYKKSSRRQVIVAAGTLDRWYIKGFDRLIIAFAALATEFPAWELHIAGGGSEGAMSYLNERISEYKLEGKVRLLGRCNDLDRVFRESSIFVLSSRHEGLPLVLIEALSQGALCVSLDIETGPNEIITDGVDGFLVADSQNELGLAMRRAVEQFDSLEDVAMAGVHRSRDYEVTKIVHKWEEVFAKVLDASEG